MYQLQIEEIVRISRALQYRGTPSEDEEAVLLVAQLNTIRPLGSESDSTTPPSPANVTFLTPTIPRHLQVTASATAPCARVCTVASGSAPLMCQLCPVQYRNRLACTGLWGVKQWYRARRPPRDARLRSWVRRSSVCVGIALLRPRIHAGCAGVETRVGGHRWSEITMHVSAERITR